MAAPALPDPEIIRQTATEVIRRRAFSLEHESNSDQILFSLIRRFLEAWMAVFRWLFKLVEGLPEWLQWVVVIGMLAVLVAILGHMA